MGIGDKWRFLSDKWKYTIGIGIIFCMICVVYGGSVYAKNRLQKQIGTSGLMEKTSSTSELVKINQKIPLFFDEKDANFLAETVTEEQIVMLEKEVNQVTQSTPNKGTEIKSTDYEKEVEKVNEGLQKIKQTYETKNAINSLYKSNQNTSAIRGSVVKKDLPIVDDLKKDTFQKIKDSYSKTTNEQEYDKTINELLTNVESQLTQIEKAKAEVEKIYKDNQVISTDLTLYDTAKAETDKIKNEKAKKTFSDQLEKVKKEIDTKGNEDTESTEQSINVEPNQSNDLAQNSTNTEQGNEYNDNNYTPSGNDNGEAGATPAPDNSNGNSNGTEDSGKTGNTDDNQQGETSPEKPNNDDSGTGNSGDQSADTTMN